MTIRIIRESHETPADVEAALAFEGGLNRYGGPNFRAVWSNNRLEWVKADFDKLHQRPKYEHKPDRWVIERWLPAEKYAGYWNEEELGPFPAHGDYECSFVVETTKQDFIQLTPAIARELVRRILYGQQFSDWDRLCALKEREARAEKDADRIRHDIYSNQPSIYTGHYVSVA